jgi:AhpD family alkylhydroperoxidase
METTMTRLNPFAAAPDELQRLIDFALAAGEGLEPSLKHLVKVRASQINGCARCLHMHIQEAKKDGESDERLYLLDAWEEAPVYTDRERAALTWTEALTRICETRAPDAAYDAVMAQFTEAEVVKLTMVINAINAFNRLAVGFRSGPIGLPRLKAA